LNDTRFIPMLVRTALLASAVVSAVAPTQTSPMTLSGHVVIAAFVAELLVTFALCYVVLNVATSKDHPDNRAGDRLHRGCRRRGRRLRIPSGQPRRLVI
jgi:glycerol uptake facilitator-like aquaporin